jgi:hypothetical protein
MESPVEERIEPPRHGGARLAAAVGGLMFRFNPGVPLGRRASSRRAADGHEQCRNQDETEDGRE